MIMKPSKWQLHGHHMCVFPSEIRFIHSQNQGTCLNPWSIHSTPNKYLGFNIKYYFFNMVVGSIVHIG
jgi:5-keto 4-deoxyuronate isomerase